MAMLRSVCCRPYVVETKSRVAKAAEVEAVNRVVIADVLLLLMSAVISPCLASQAEGV